MKTPDLHLEKRHPIQVAANRSGLTQDVLRAWEKRYGVVEPGRSGGRQRLYSDDDVERLRLLKLAVDGGRRISEVAGLEREELTTLALGDQVGRVASRSLPSVDPVALVECLEAIEQLDAVRLEETLSRQLLTAGSVNVIEGLVAPLMVEVGGRWHEGRLAASHEHLATEVLRGLVARVLARSQPRAPRGTLVIATTPGQRHEVGGLLAAAAAAQERWRTVYLGAELPADEIAGAVRQVHAGAVALSFAFRNEDSDDIAEIRQLTHALPANVKLIVGGAAAQEARAELVALGAVVVENLGAFRRTLEDAVSAS